MQVCSVCVPLQSCWSVGGEVVLCTSIIMLVGWEGGSFVGSISMLIGWEGGSFVYRYNHVGRLGGR